MLFEGDRAHDGLRPASGDRLDESPDQILTLQGEPLERRSSGSDLQRNRIR